MLQNGEQPGRPKLQEQWYWIENRHTPEPFWETLSTSETIVEILKGYLTQLNFPSNPVLAKIDTDFFLLLWVQEIYDIDTLRF